MNVGVSMAEVVDIVLLVLLAATGIAIIRLRNLFAAVMLAGIYSLVSAALFTVMDAVDVAFTEAAVGAGISTVLMLGTLALVGYKEAEPRHKPLLPLFVVLVTGGILVYGTSQLPPFGDPDNPAHHHVAPYYLEESLEDTEIPNVVTSVLASYRGYDTMGETTVVFTALVGVLLLLARGPLPRRVFHEGRWITARPGETREELEAELKKETADTAEEVSDG
jgi:multicomponent Na+:H+ antiporter subunit B